MGQCLGKPKQKNVKTYVEDETLEEKRRKAAEAAEMRMVKQSSKGVVNSGGVLSKKIEKQKSIGPHRINDDNFIKENKALDPSVWN